MRSKLQYLIIFLFLLINTSCIKKVTKEHPTPPDKEIIKPADEEHIRNVKMLSAKALGLAYMEEHKLEEAEKEFKKVIELAPDESLGYANLGIVYLRMGNYKEAEKQLLKAKELDPEDADIRLNLSKVYELKHEKEKSISELKESIEIKPDHIKSLYSLAETYSGYSDKNSMAKWEKYLNKIVKAAPSNIVSKLYLTELLIKKEDKDGAIKQLEELARIFPQFPQEAEEYYKKTLEDLYNDNLKESLTSFRIFHNYLKLTKPYQSGIQKLKGTSGANVGHPIMSFSESASTEMNKDGSILESIQFADATESAFLETPVSNSEFISLSVADIDEDGDIDLFYASGNKYYLFQNEFGRYDNILEQSNIKINGKVRNSAFADYNNDGYLDLMVVKENGIQLFLNVAEGKFKDVTDTAFKDHQKIKALTCLFVDADHDGDLDLFLGGRNDQMFRNNGDGTFKNITLKMGFGKNKSSSRDASLGDFDDDGDIDLFITRENGNNALYSNLRQGVFRNIASKAGLHKISKSISTGVSDYNNDGFLDLFIVTSDGSYKLYKNKKNGTFTEDKTSSQSFNVLKSININDITFFDFDNDGYQDIFVAGDTKNNGKRRNFLFHNNGKGRFKDLSRLLPQNLPGNVKVALADYNADGDEDLFLAGNDGKLRLIRNDGGNGNHFLKMKLVGIKTGSSKNNYFGIGAKVEVRAGDLYQMQVVTTPEIHFGMGNRTKADVVRILWSNGVPQNIFSPGSDIDLIENQELKGSCPFLYTWNGHEFIFVKDMMWRSALGMPLGIMGGKKAFAFADASEEYLKIPGELLHEKDGKYTIQITEELWETIYNDQIKLIAVDHPQEADIYVDEKFSPPPYPELKIFTVKNHHLPVSVSDGKGNNLLECIRKKDFKYISNFEHGKYQGITKMKDLILDLGSIRNTQDLYLFLNGWIFPTDASINVALSQSERIKVKPPSLEVINKKGEWEEVISNIGFPSGKNKTIIVNLSDKFLSSERKLRIRTNMEIYWDYIFFAKDESLHITTTEMNPESADHHYRGFSKQFRKKGRYGPHWFDYNRVIQGQKWRDLTGTYTDFGDVTELLQQADNMYIIANAGDETTISFNTIKLPKLKKGWQRDFLIYSVGWVKDGDLNTATGQTVKPLPFHGMSHYPYGKDEHYPTTKKLTDYQKKYNNRKIDTYNFQTHLSAGKLQE